MIRLDLFFQTINKKKKKNCTRPTPQEHWRKEQKNKKATRCGRKQQGTANSEQRSWAKRMHKTIHVPELSHRKDPDFSHWRELK
jgi:hypothetical protein